MQVRDIVEQVIQEVLSDRNDLFIVKNVISEGLDIHLTIDGDELVNISDCIEISRKIEQSLDRDEFDFSIKVQSPGADEPLVYPRQYKKHVGRKLKLKTASEKIEGTLKKVTDEGVELAWKVREKKPVGKGKVTVKYEKTIPFHKIEKANIKLTFNKN